MLGESHIALVGGTENMSQAPYAARNIRFGTKLGADLQVSSVTHSAMCSKLS